MSCCPDRRIPSSDHVALGSSPLIVTTILAAALGLAPRPALAQDSVQWQFKGRIVDQNPAGEENFIHQFDKTGTDGSAVDAQYGHSSSAIFQPNAHADSSTHTLKSGATIEASVQAWDSLSALGQAVATYSDRVTVRSDGAGGGALSLTWSINGKLKSTLSADLGGVMYWSYYVDAELYALSNPPNQPGERASIFHENISRGSISGGESLCVDLIDVASHLNMFDRNELTEERSFDVGQYTHTILVPYQVNLPVSLTVGLATCVNFRASQIDIDAVNLLASSEFHNSASLVSVQVLDEHLQPLTVPFELVSENGLTYPVQQVPEPSSGVLTLVGAAFTAWISRRRRLRAGEFFIRCSRT